MPRTSSLLNHFYPRPPRGGRRLHVVAGQIFLAISIHALREEGDRLPRKPSPADCYFYPRPPRGGRPLKLWSDEAAELFLSTPSARRATPDAAIGADAVVDFYPRPPRGGRLTFITQQCIIITISIHALREEGDRSEIRCL